MLRAKGCNEQASVAFVSYALVQRFEGHPQPELNNSTGALGKLHEWF